MKKKITIIVVLLLAVLSYFIVNYHSNVNNKYLGRIPSIVKRYEPQLSAAYHNNNGGDTRLEIGSRKIIRRLKARCEKRISKYLKNNSIEKNRIPVVCKYRAFNIKYFKIDDISPLGSISLTNEVAYLGSDRDYSPHNGLAIFLDKKGNELHRKKIEHLYKHWNRNIITCEFMLNMEDLVYLEHLDKIVIK